MNAPDRFAPGPESPAPLHLDFLMTLPERDLVGLARLLTLALDAPAAAIELTAGGRRWLAAHVGLDPAGAGDLGDGDTPTDPGAVHVERDPARLTGTPRVARSGVTPRVRMSLPLHLDGSVFGRVAVLSDTPRGDLDTREREALATVASLLVDLVQARLELYTRASAEEDLRYAVEHASCIAFRTDAALRLTELNHAGRQVLRAQGVDPDDARLADLLVGDEHTTRVLQELVDRTRPKAVLRVVLSLPGGERTFVARLRARQDPDGSFGGLVGVLDEGTLAALESGGSRDDLERRVSERTVELEALNARLHHDALHDALTGLPNRAKAYERLARLVEHNAGRTDHTFAALFLDCDRFKNINDTMGHRVGDELLIAFGRRIQSALRPSDLVARLGGDEFIVLLDGVESGAAALKVAERLTRALSTPFYLQGHAVHVGASIGLVTGSGQYVHADEVLRDADIAMYRAKSTARGGVVSFTEDMREDTVSTMRLEVDLRQALERNELSVCYQPIVALSDERLLGLEALVRWRHPTRGTLVPSEFLALAEETGLIVEVDRWVLFEGCRQMREWASSGLDGGHLSVNFCSQQFTRSDLLETVHLILEATGFPASRLRIEITESLVMQRSERVAQNVDGLRRMGVTLDIDDFGTGYSSLGYLQRFAASTLKIDRSFVSGMTEDPRQEELVRTIVTLAHNLGMQVTAEGVETPEQIERLRSLRCEAAQGYLFARPLEVHEVVARLQQARTVPG